MADQKLSALIAAAENTAPAGSDMEYNVTGGNTSKGIYKGSNNLLPNGHIINGKLSVTVASNNLTVALKTLSGGNPSATDPVSIWINGAYRRITAATSITMNAAINWFNAGGSELATKEIDYFAYLIWNTTPATDIMQITVARFPFGRVYSDFSGTPENEKYLAYPSDIPASTDDCTVIGRFAATLSAGAGYTWTVPTYTNANLIHHPIYETRVLDWTPAWSASGSMTYTSVTTTIAKYQIRERGLKAFARGTGTIGGTPSTSVLLTLPFESAYVGTALEQGVGTGDSVMGRVFLAAGTPDQISILRYDSGNWTAGSRAAAAEIEYWI